MADKVERKEWILPEGGRDIYDLERHQIALFGDIEDARLALALHNAAIKINSNPMAVAEKIPQMYEVCRYLTENGWNAGVSEEAKEVIAAINKPATTGE